MTLKFATASSFVATKSLRWLLHHHLTGYETQRPISTVHASDLTKSEEFCPRYYALHDVTGAKPKDRWLSTSEAVTYQIGHDEQQFVIKCFADMDKAIAHWRCQGCGKEHVFCKRPKHCTNCGCKALRAEEVRFHSAVSGASCGVDMLLSLEGPKLTPVEIKTIDKEQFKALAVPLAEHRVRSKLYLRIIAESTQSWSNLVGTQQIKVLYVTKGGYGIADPSLKVQGLPDQYTPFKEFSIARDDEPLDDLCHRAKVVKEFREGKVPMPCGVCATGMVKRAMYCSMKGHCWSGDHPPEYDWKKT